MFAPADTARNEFHGPLEEVPTCFNRLMAGAGSFTSTVAVEVLPVPPLVELTVTVLVLRPVVVPVTVTLKEQLPPPLIEPPLSDMVDGEVVVNVPPHCEEDELAIVKPLGRVSVKLTPVSPVEVLGLLMEKVSVVVLPVKIGLAVKDLAMTGGSTTVMLA